MLIILHKNCFSSRSEISSEWNGLAPSVCRYGIFLNNWNRWKEAENFLFLSLSRYFNGMRIYICVNIKFHSDSTLLKIISAEKHKTGGGEKGKWSETWKVEAFFSILTLITFLSFIRIFLCLSEQASKNTFDIKMNINRLEAAIQLTFPSIIDTFDFSSYNKQILGEKTREKAPQ